MTTRIKKEAEIVINKEEAIEDLKMLYGYPPHDNPRNHCYCDGFFDISLEKKYGVDTKELAKITGFDEMLSEWRSAKVAFNNSYR